MVYWGYVHVSLWYRLCVCGMLLYLCMVCVVCELGYVCYEFTHVATTTMWLFPCCINTEPGAALCSHALPTGFLSPSGTCLLTISSVSVLNPLALEFQALLAP